MTPLIAYQMYNSIKLHFNDAKYDYFKFKLNPKVFTASSFESRNDKYKFEKLSKQFENRTNAIEDLEMALSSWFLYNPTSWIGDIVDAPEKSFNYVAKRTIYRGNIGMAFKSDIDPVYVAIDLSHSGNFSDYLTPTAVVDGQEVRKFPKIIDMVAQHQILPETVMILNERYRFINNTDVLMANNTIWKAVSGRLNKFKRFIKVTDKELVVCYDYIERKNQEVRS